MAEKLTQIELDSIQLHETKPRCLTRSSDAGLTQEDDVETGLGSVRVSVQGDRSKAAILTYHDIGLNSHTCFQGFFQHEDMQAILRHFCVYHITAPGQQEGALPLPQGSGLKHSESEKLLNEIGKEHPPAVKPAAPLPRSMAKRLSLGFTGDPSAVTGYHYPTMDQLGEMLLPVLQHYGLKRVIGFGMGAGANILCRFALQHPDRVEALVLINGTAGKAGWSEWGYQKINSWWLKGGNMSVQTEEYLLWHWFGKKVMNTNNDLVLAFTNYMKMINPQNLAHFIESYIKRSDLGIVRELDPTKKAHVKMLRCPIMLVVGDYSAHLDQTVAMNSRLDPTDSNFVKFNTGGMVLEEAPEKMVESFRLFLQGMGYIPSMSQTSIVAKKSMMSRGSIVNGSSQVLPPVSEKEGQAPC